MKKQKLKLQLLLLFLFLATFFVTVMTSCTKNQRAKQWGGKATVFLPKGEKLITATWKESNLWYLTRPMKNDEVAETYTFREESSFGMMEGTYTIREVK